LINFGPKARHYSCGKSTDSNVANPINLIREQGTTLEEVKIKFRHPLIYKA